MSAKKTVSKNDSALFRDAVGEVKSVRNDKIDLTDQKPVPAAPRTASKAADDKSVMAALLDDLSENDLLETGEHLAYTSEGVQRSVLRKLKSGKYSLQEDIDLHGYTVNEARIVLSEFLKKAREKRHLCVRIIHGKGLKQPDKAPRLKPAVNQWLQRNNAVIAFCSARECDGGTGAVYVLLKRPEN